MVKQKLVNDVKEYFEQYPVADEYKSNTNAMVFSFIFGMPVEECLGMYPENEDADMLCLYYDVENAVLMMNGRRSRR